MVDCAQKPSVKLLAILMALFIKKSRLVIDIVHKLIGRDRFHGLRPLDHSKQFSQLIKQTLGVT